MRRLTRREWEAISSALRATLAGILDGFDEDTPEYDAEVKARQSALAKVEERLGYAND